MNFINFKIFITILILLIGNCNLKARTIGREDSISTTERPLSFNAKAHLFFLQLLGKSDLIEKQSATPVPNIYQSENLEETSTTTQQSTTKITTTTEALFEWFEKWPIEYENGTYGHELTPVSKRLVEIYDKVNEFMKARGDRKGLTPHPWWIKVYITQPMDATTKSLFSTSVQTEEGIAEGLRTKFDFTDSTTLKSDF